MYVKLVTDETMNESEVESSCVWLAALTFSLLLFACSDFVSRRGATGKGVDLLLLLMEMYILGTLHFVETSNTDRILTDCTAFAFGTS